MITVSNADFPENVQAIVAARIKPAVDADLTVVRRMLRPSDPSQSVGVFAQTKLPDNTSVEFRSVEPTLRTYNCILQSVVIDTDEEACNNIHSQLAQRLWRMLLHDNPLLVGLTSLSVTTDNIRERFQNHGIVQQRYLSNEVQGNFIATAWIEWWFKTETVAL